MLILRLFKLRASVFYQNLNLLAELFEDKKSPALMWNPHFPLVLHCVFVLSWFCDSNINQDI